MPGPKHWGVTPPPFMGAIHSLNAHVSIFRIQRERKKSFAKPRLECGVLDALRFVYILSARLTHFLSNSFRQFSITSCVNLRNVGRLMATNYLSLLPAVPLADLSRSVVTQLVWRPLGHASSFANPLNRVPKARDVTARRINAQRSKLLSVSVTFSWRSHAFGRELRELSTL